MSRRDQIQMTDAELRAFLAEQRTVICATNGVRGWPHLMPLWFIVRGGEIWAWTYAKSQKVRNLERNPRATLQIETGDSYDQLRGVMVEATAELHRDTDEVAALGAEILARYGGGDARPRSTMRSSPRRANAWACASLFSASPVGTTASSAAPTSRPPRERGDVREISHHPLDLRRCLHSRA